MKTGITPPSGGHHQHKRLTALLSSKFALGALALAGVLVTANAQTTYIKANNNIALNSAGSYTANSGVPGSLDTIQFDSTDTLGTAPPLGGNLTVNAITQATGTAAGITIGATSGSTLTIGAGGITKNVSGYGLSLACALALGANQTWTINANGGTGLVFSGTTFNDNGHTLLITNVTGPGLFDCRPSGPVTFGPNVSIVVGQVNINNAAADVTLGGANTYKTLLIAAGTVEGSTFPANTGAATTSNFGNANSGSVIFGAGSASACTLIYNGNTASTPKIFQLAVGSGNTGAGTIKVSTAGQTLTLTNLSYNGTAAVNRNWGFGGAGNLTIAGAIANPAGSFTAGITKNDAGTLTLGGTNTYSGTTLINGGALALAANGSISNTSVIYLAGGTKFDVSGRSSTFVLQSSQAISNNPSSLATLAGNLNSGSGTFAITFSPGTAPLTITNGTLTLSSGTVFSLNSLNPRLSVGGVYPLITPGPGGSVGGTAPYSSAGSLAFTGGTGHLVVTSGQLNLVIDSATLPGVEPLHWAGSGSGTWDAADSGNTIWNDSTTPTPLTTYFVNSDTVQFDEQNISANQAVTLNSTVSPTSTLVSNVNYSYSISGSGAIGGIGGLTKNGTGTLTLATANTYSGGTVINNGTVAMGNVTALGASGATITVNSGGVLDMNGMSMPSANTYAMNINGSGPSGAGAFIDGIATGALFYGSVALGSDSTIKENGATWQLGDGSHACPISGNHVLTVGGSSGYLVSVYGNVSVASIIKVDAGQLKMNSANSFAGGLTVKNGNVSVTSSGAFGSGTVTLLDTAGTYGAKLGLGATGNITNSLVVQAGSTGVPIIDNYGGSFTPVWAGNITLNNTNTALSLQTASATPTGYTSVSGPISGPGALSIDNPYSAGIVKLYGTNTYTGATYINLGTLALLNNASISNSSVISIVGGATLDVSGLTSGTFVLSSGQTLSNSTTATGNLNGNVDASRGNFVVNYDGSTPVFAVSGGSLTLSAGTTFSITNLSGAALGTNTLISSGVAGTAPAAVNLLRGAGHLQINSGALQLVVTTSSTPTVPVFTPGGGAYYGALTVTITSDAGTTIHYTTDGSDPTTSGTVQSAASPAAVTVAAGVVNETIRACATQPGSANSGVAAASYNTTLSSAFAVQPLVAGTNDSTLRNNYTGYTGYTFTNSSEPILVTALGYADGTLQGTNGSGLGSTHTVALWNAAGTLIASVTVPAGTAGQYLNGYWYAALASPVTLTPNTGYTLAASQVSGGDMWPNSLGSYFPGYSLPTFSGIATIADANAVWGNNYPAPPNNVDTIGTSVWLTCNLQGSIAPSIAIQPVKLANGNVQFNALGAYGASYRIWASTNLALAPVTSTWSNVSSGTFTGQSVSYTDTAATNYPARFYVITIP